MTIFEILVLVGVFLICSSEGYEHDEYQEHQKNIFGVCCYELGVQDENECLELVRHNTLKSCLNACVARKMEMIDEEGNFLEQFIDQVTENEDKASKDALECMDSVQRIEEKCEKMHLYFFCLGVKEVTDKKVTFS